MTVKGGTETYDHASNRSSAQTIFVIHRRRPKFASVIHCLKNSLDSFGALKSNQRENFAQRHTPCTCPYSGRTTCARGNVVRDANARWRLTGERLSSHQGGRRWLTYSFSARARVHQFQRVSELSGFCSKAFRASLFQCAARPAVKCIRGSPRMHG